MNHMQRKTAVYVVIAIMAIAAVSGAVYYLNDDRSDNDGGPLTVTDVLGRTVTLPAEVTKIVCLSAGSVRLVTYFGSEAVDRIVGIDSYDAGTTANPSNYDMATYRLAYDLRGIANVGSEDNYKDIIATGAQVIITSKTSAADVETIQTNTGITVVAVSADGSIDVDEAGFEQDIRLVGQVLGMDARAQTLLDGIAALGQELSDCRAAMQTSATCYVGGMFYFMKGGLYMTTGSYYPFVVTGATNTMPDSNNGNPYQTDKKALMEAGADYLFIDGMTLTASSATFAADRADLSTTVNAVQDGNIYATWAYKYYGTNWENELVNAFFIGAVLDPTAFSYDVTEKAQAILDLFFPDAGLTVAAVAAQQGEMTRLAW